MDMDLTMKLIHRGTDQGTRSNFHPIGLNRESNDSDHFLLNSGNRGKNLFAATDAKKNRFLAPFVRRGSPLPVPYLSVRVRGSI